MNHYLPFTGLLLAAIAFAGCSEKKTSNKQAAPDNNGGSNGGSDAGMGEAVGGESVGGSAVMGSGGAGQAEKAQQAGPTEPFVIEGGVCKPNLIDAPDPIYESGNFNASITSVTGTRDEVFFSESATFNEIPPRIARVASDGKVETLLDGEFTKLKVFGDSLYFVSDEKLMSLDLSKPGAAPQGVMTVSGLLDYNDSTVLYADDDGAVWSAPLGAQLPAETATEAEASTPGDAGMALAGNAASTGDAALAGSTGGNGDAGVVAAGDAGKVAADPGVLLIAKRPWDVSLFEDTVYFSDGDTVLRVSVDGGEPTELFPPDSFNFITSVGTDGSLVFFDNEDMLTTVPAAGGEPMELGRAGKDSLFNDTAAFSQFLSGKGVVYWVDDGSGFGWTALDGQSCGLLGRYSSFFDARAHLTDDALYVGGDSGLYRVPRVD